MIEEFDDCSGNTGFSMNDRVLIKQGEYAGRVGKVSGYTPDYGNYPNWKIWVGFKKKPSDKFHTPPLLANKDWLLKV